jgi:hypothetical protein
MSHTSGSGSIGQPSSLGYTRAGALVGSFVRTDSVKMGEFNALQLVPRITVISFDPVVPDLTHLSAFVRCEKPSAVLGCVAGNTLALG